MNPEWHEDNRREPTPEEQKEFDELWKNVLLACDVIVFNTPGANEKFAEMLGGQDKVDRYYYMRGAIKVELKQGRELGIKTRLNG